MKKQNYSTVTTSKLIFTFLFVFLFISVFAEKQVETTNKTIDPIDSLIAPQHTNRYFIFPSAFPLKKKEMYYRTFIVVHQVNMGISKNFELGVGTMPLFLIDGTSSPVWLVPKVSFPTKNKNIRLGVNGLVGRMIGKRNRDEFIDDLDLNLAAFIHGVVSYQNQNLSVSAGGGFGYWGKHQQKATYIVSAQYRVKKRGFVMMESFYTPNSSSRIKGLNFIGGRKVWKNEIFVDFGLIIPTAASDLDSDINFLAVPWVNVAIPIKKKWYNSKLK